MPHYDTIIRNGMIVDGQRNSRFRGDIGITDGIIARIGKISADASCDRDEMGREAHLDPRNLLDLWRMPVSLNAVGFEAATEFAEQVFRFFFAPSSAGDAGF